MDRNRMREESRKYHSAELSPFPFWRCKKIHVSYVLPSKAKTTPLLFCPLNKKKRKNPHLCFFLLSFFFFCFFHGGRKPPLESRIALLFALFVFSFVSSWLFFAFFRNWPPSLPHFSSRSQGQKCPMGLSRLPRRRKGNLRQPPLPPPWRPPHRHRRSRPRGALQLGSPLAAGMSPAICSMKFLWEFGLLLISFLSV